MKKSIKKIQHRRNISREHVDKKLRRRITMFIVIVSSILSVAVYNIAMNKITPLPSLLGLCAGTIIGLVAGRMFKMSWDEETEKVVSRLDRIGVIFLVLYIAIEIGRKWVFGYWMHGAKLNAFGLIFLGGLLLGRLLTMMKNIKKVLIQEEKLI
ncbi:MAG: hypothetical protein OEV66_00250 [Spirochaetia bacterium]|nr:hypothetical protein [Spirochaetia bacterium]